MVKMKGYDWSFATASQDSFEPFGFHAIPTTIFIDKQGAIVETVTGGMTVSDFESKLAKIL